MTSQLIRSIDEALKECKKKWDQVLSLRIFYRHEMNISGDFLISTFVADILKRSKTIPAITSVPVSALNSRGDSLIACTLHIL